MTIALKEKRVLVIDGDMRHGSVSQYVGSPELGLADYLSGMEADVDRLIVPYNEVNTLFILPVGSIPPNPSELLESPRFGELIGRLKTQYDYVIVDCPPIEVVADAQIIDKYMDRTFFIIRADLFERSMLPELDRLYDEKKYSNMAFILNGTRNDQGRYGYGYGYGYGYNYGSDGQPAPPTITIIRITTSTVINALSVYGSFSFDGYAERLRHYYGDSRTCSPISDFRPLLR